jgi:phosphatidylserine decarboxylase
MSLLLHVRIHPEGWRFIGIFGAVALLLFLVAQPLGWLGMILTGWCAYFFRNPQRITPTRPGLMVSPADGIVCAIKEMAPPEEFSMGTAPRIRISIFLNVFDVHVNRIPMGGKIIKSIYHSGKFLNAALTEASDCNERQSLVIELGDQTKIAVVQIAGLIARRIVCTAKEGDAPETGEIFGLIRFGSRTDVYLPEGVFPLVIEGQKMIGGETILADFTSQESSREGICH